MLSGLLTTERVSHLGETLNNICDLLQTTYCIKIFDELYKNFNSYCIELTISPKSSPILNQAHNCPHCDSSQILHLEYQVILLHKLINRLIHVYDINILGVIELYSDKNNIHCHCIMNNQNPHKIKLIKNYIKKYYQALSSNKSIVNIQEIRDRDNYRAYMKKDYLNMDPDPKYNPIDEPFFYYNANDENNIEFYEQEIFKKKEEAFKISKQHCTCIECDACKNLTV